VEVHIKGWHHAYKQEGYSLQQGLLILKENKVWYFLIFSVQFIQLSWLMIQYTSAGDRRVWLLILLWQVLWWKHNSEVSVFRDISLIVVIIERDSGREKSLHFRDCFDVGLLCIMDGQFLALT